jgi:hypothetical protein
MEDALSFYDDFTDDRSAGNVIGTPSASGHKRLGVDAEKVIGIDNGALRIAPLVEAGFGRAVLSYGPFFRRDGLAFSVRILNGHNTAQAESLPETFRERIRQWMWGSYADPRIRRLFRWIASGRVRRTLRQFRWWMTTAKGSDPVPVLNENLAVGWFPKDVVADPRKEGNPFIMHALGPKNGELWVGGVEQRTRSLRGVQNLPFYLVSVVRPGGIVYYASSMHGVPCMAPHPYLSPVAVEKCSDSADLYLGIEQSVLGQIGWRIDTRVQGVRVATLGGYDSWWWGAHAADGFKGDGDLDGAVAEVGGTWRVYRGEESRLTGRDQGTGTEGISVLDPAAPTGLIHAEMSFGEGDRGRAGLIWRFVDERNHWRMELGRRGCEIVLVEDGVRHVQASKVFPDPSGALAVRLQLLDDGRRMTGHVDGEPVTDRYIEDARLDAGTGVGFLIVGAERGDRTAPRFFEAHPRCVRMPEILDMGSPWERTGDRTVAADDFDGTAGDLEGRLLTVDGHKWSRVIGSGIIETTGSGTARIKGTVRDPCPGRTAYCIDWGQPDFADVEVVITPPGTERGQGERCIAGFILYQDDDNYVTLNAWRADSYGGASISTFFKFGGFEDIYDAVWTNVGDRVFYGSPARLRLCSDGERYLAFVNDEPVLYRAFRDVYGDAERLRIRKVGLLANWEFGNDTGSRFERFRARY